MTNNKIKIVYIIPTLNTGGAEKMLVDLILGLDKEKFEPELICLKRSGILGEKLTSDNIQINTFNFKSGLDVTGFRKLYLYLKKQKPDIVHTHLFGADVHGIIAAKLAGVKLIFSTEHNINLQESVLKRFVKSLIYSEATKIIAVSGAVEEYLKKWKIRDGSIRVIYNGIDANKFIRTRNPNEKIIIGALGRFTKQKAFNVLIEAINIIRNENIECRIAGFGEEESNLKRQVESLELTEKIKFFPKQDNAEEFLNGLDIFVFPSLWEGLGIVALEAGAMELPVVASDLPAIKEIIENGKDGLLFETGSPKDLADKLLTLTKDQGKRIDLGYNLNKKIKSKFGIESMVKNYEAIYSTRDD